MSGRDTASGRIGAGRALVIGVGGLGCPAATALARAGVSTIGLVDPDVVDLSNLHRQLLYRDADVGRPKVDVAAARLAEIAPDCHVIATRARFDARDAGLLADFDVVLDGTDSIATKFAVSDAAIAARVPLVHAGAIGFQAQILTILPGVSACYRCIFEEAPPEGDVPACEEAGVLGPVPALAGALQAAEALRLLAGEPPLFADRLLSIDLRAGTWRSVPVARSSHCAACGRAGGLRPSARRPSEAGGKAAGCTGAILKETAS
jgi:molybdopterin/thiamine biosynthesis adenylyltransferase